MVSDHDRVGTEVHAPAALLLAAVAACCSAVLDGGRRQSGGGDTTWRSSLLTSAKEGWRSGCAPCGDPTVICCCFLRIQLPPPDCCMGIPGSGLGPSIRWALENSDSGINDFGFDNDHFFGLDYAPGDASSSAAASRPRSRSEEGLPQQNRYRLNCKQAVPGL